MSLPMFDEYTIWFEPEGEGHDAYRHVIESLAQEHGTPMFEPHVTLLGGIKKEEKEIIEVLTQFASTMHPFEIAIEQTPMFEPIYHKACYLSCDSFVLMEYNAALQTLFGVSSNYEPHLSLLYGESPEEALLPMLPPTIEVHSISLWHAKGTVSEWKKVREFPFK